MSLEDRLRSHMNDWVARNMSELLSLNEKTVERDPANNSRVTVGPSRKWCFRKDVTGSIGDLE